MAAQVVYTTRPTRCSRSRGHLASWHHRLLMGLRMTDQAALGTVAIRTLAAIRIANGALGLVAPQVLVKRTSTDPTSVEPYYAFRMFGIRTLVLGLDLLTLTGASQERARAQAVLIHATDTACAALGGLRGDLPARAARTTVAISAVNTALAVVAHRASSKG